MLGKSTQTEHPMAEEGIHRKGIVAGSRPIRLPGPCSRFIVRQKGGRLVPQKTFKLTDR